MFQLIAMQCSISQEVHVFLFLNPQEGFHFFPEIKQFSSGARRIEWNFVCFRHATVGLPLPLHDTSDTFVPGQTKYQYNLHRRYAKEKRKYIKIYQNRTS